MRQILILAIICLVSLQMSAQDSFDRQQGQAQLVETSGIDNSIYMDEEERICYVDLEKVPFVLTQAVIINKEGNEVLTKSLKEEKVDTIVELEYGELPSGAYMLELRSYNGKTVKALHL